MDELIFKQVLLAEYDKRHMGPPGGARKLIEEAPAVDAVPVVHGRWESIHRYNNGERAIGICSACKGTGELRTKRDEWCWWVIDSPYCPNCGAKMDLEANNENN